MADADANLAPGRFGDDLESAGKLRRDGHHAHVAARGLPQAVKDLQRGLDQVFRGMHAAALVAEKRTFEMDSQRPCLQRIAFTKGTLSGFDGVG